jgi:hypothetical protein
LRITQIAPKSPAAQAGLSAGLLVERFSKCRTERLRKQ